VTGFRGLGVESVGARGVYMLMVHCEIALVITVYAFVFA
jgi:hypothetical protein